MFEWDENKRKANLVKHGFDFLHVDQILCQTHISLESGYGGEEPRFLAVGKIQGRFATVIYTMRGENYRIISIRSARNDEKRAYSQLHG